VNEHQSVNNERHRWGILDARGGKCLLDIWDISHRTLGQCSVADFAGTMAHLKDEKGQGISGSESRLVRHSPNLQYRIPS
jgi:hypothetical protein